MHGYFKGQKRLRLGDPLSPFLFKLCIDYLRRLIRGATTGSNFNFHPLCQRMGITHLAYADDLLLFSRVDGPSVSILSECFATFGRYAVIRANHLMSNVYMSGIDDATRSSLFEHHWFLAGYIPLPLSGDSSCC